MAQKKPIGSPRVHVRFNEVAMADLQTVKAWLGERMADPTDTDAVRAALRHTAEMVKKKDKKTEKNA